ncbi:unnamed protein product, partial [Ilex paraguariensis]
MASQRPFSSCKQPLKVPESPNQPMEFLCRPWSPSASDFLDIFSSSNFLLPPSANDRTVEDEEKQLGEILQKEHTEEQVDEMLKNTSQRNKAIASKGNNNR